MLEIPITMRWALPERLSNDRFGQSKKVGQYRLLLCDKVINLINQKDNGPLSLLVGRIGCFVLWLLLDVNVVVIIIIVVAGSFEGPAPAIRYTGSLLDTRVITGAFLLR